MTTQIDNRKIILRALKNELVGPSPAGLLLKISKLPVEFQTLEDSYGPFVVEETKEEIINRDYPTKRYGIGILYPFATRDEEQSITSSGADVIGLVNESSDIELPSKNPDKKIEKQKAENFQKIQNSLTNLKTDENQTDYDLSLANSYNPSSIGVTFLGKVIESSKLRLIFTGGRYYQFPVIVNKKNKIWWYRKPVKFVVEIAGLDLLEKKIIHSDETNIIESINLDDLLLKFEIFSRSYSEIDQETTRLITVSIVNRTNSSNSHAQYDEKCIFQSRFTAELVTNETPWNILPYPAKANHTDDEEKSMDLLYRNNRTFCVGHGCSGDWIVNQENQSLSSLVSAEVLPTFEVPSMTPDIIDEHGQVISIPMAPLAGLDENVDGYKSLEKLITSYENWINEKKIDVTKLPPSMTETGHKHINNAQTCLERMKKGFNFLKTNLMAAEAFQLANRAILFQQIRPKDKRRMRYIEDESRCEFETYEEVSPLFPGKNKGTWRAFQIAFLLMSIESTALGNIPDRDIVELIWFPTGGGKTEAYLGLIAFSIFFRRLKDPNDNGVNVLMRYTLRLLTTQQFQRASRLILAMEKIRRVHPEKLGSKEFSIGMWVGSSNTPNLRGQALKLLRDIEKRNATTEYKFVLDRCPWCGAEIGPISYKKKKPRFAPNIIGLEQEGETVKFYCPDNHCDFSSGLPIYIIDEDVYEFQPSMVIGTVDKFAMLTWKPESRSLFGIDKNGNRFCSPPSLIVQDELHLISGPLGSMVGLYESVIDELCTDRRVSPHVKPKIISSTATIRRYEEQVKNLYGRKQVNLFPPPGLDAGDSFFARYATDENNHLLPGRLYVGVHAPGLGSMQTVQVRSFTALLQAPMELPENERDPWWTLLLFFNSLRELGTTLSLLQSDIPNYQRALINRLAYIDKNWRNFWNINELTGRANNQDIPKALSNLEVQFPSNNPYPVDVCLASNILEVGVDIDRLSLMSVIGQPKTTSQYIQVTGRVGRSWWERPGLVVTLYSASKPRDRSHFEKFRTYHERLYAQVEPTSVTPFSPPALDRALHAILVAYVRQLGNEDIANKPFPYPIKLIEEFRNILLPRIKFIDPEEVENFDKIFKKLTNQWETWERLKWEGNFTDDNDPLLIRAGTYTPPEKKRGSWETPTSMRNVDSECIVEIANALLQGDENAE